MIRPNALGGKFQYRRQCVDGTFSGSGAGRGPTRPRAPGASCQTADDQVILNFGLYRYGFILFRESYFRQTCLGGNILVKPV